MDRLTHLLDQLSGDLARIAESLGNYRRHLKAQGLSDTEVHTLVTRMEERLMGPVLEQGERALDEQG